MTIARETAIKTTERTVVNSSKMNVVRVDDTEELEEQRMVTICYETIFPERLSRLLKESNEWSNTRIEEGTDKFKNSGSQLSEICKRQMNAIANRIYLFNSTDYI